MKTALSIISIFFICSGMAKLAYVFCMMYKEKKGKKHESNNNKDDD